VVAHGSVNAGWLAKVRLNLSFEKKSNPHPTSRFHIASKKIGIKFYQTLVLSKKNVLL
jgi:hypothetical protein